MRIDKVNILIFFLFFSILAFSQNNTRSPYSLNELGEINFLGNVSSVSMGGVESSLDSIEFNINNPSSLAKLKPQIINLEHFINLLETQMGL